MNLAEFFSCHPRVAVAFSGGTDSAYLLYEAKKHCQQVKAYYVKTVFQPEFELRDALRLSEELHAPLSVIEADPLSDRRIASNPQNRCYYCKRLIFSTILSNMRRDGFEVLTDGTNASDLFDHRPGMVALSELSVLSPLRICGLTKQQVRERSRQAGLFTWDKPAYACLATRQPVGTALTAEALRRTELLEDSIRAMGFSDFRVRSTASGEVFELRSPQQELYLRYKDEIDELLRGV